jgi:hypothetical protein
MSNPYKLTRVPKDHWIFAACLNLLHKRGLTVDEALDRLFQMSVPYELRYQWNSEHQETDLIALFYIAKEGEIPLSEKQEIAVWELLGNECLLSLGCNSDYENIPIRRYIEQPKPEPPEQPEWYVRVGEGEAAIAG